MPGVPAALVVSMMMFGAGAAAARDASGDWLGTLSVRPGLDLRIAVHIARAPRGDYSATWDSVDQGLFGDGTDNLVLTDAAMAFDVVTLHARYAAT